MEKTKREWCAMLAKLTAPMNPEQAVQSFIAMLPMLPLDSEAFNKTTLEYAARREPGDPAVPNFDMLSRAFAKWRRENLTAHIRLGGTPDAARITTDRHPPTDAERDHVEALVDKLKADNALRSGYDQKPSSGVEAKPVAANLLAEAYRQAGLVNPRDCR